MAKSLRSCIVASDLHLNINVADSHRWQIWHQLAGAAEEYGCKNICLLGDLTDAKDFHSAHLVNGIVDEIVSLVDSGVSAVYVLRGNHDGIDPKEPYFGFLDYLPNVHYIESPQDIMLENCGLVSFVPHMPDDELLKVFETFGAGSATTAVMAHMTVEGSVPSIPGAKRLTGVSLEALRKYWPSVPIYSGDVHKPQVIGPVEYVGSPYHTNFGEQFEPRFWIFPDDGGKRIDKLTGFARKVLVEIKSDTEKSKFFSSSDLKIGDQVKVRVTMRSDQITAWQEWAAHIRAEATRLGVHLSGVDFSIEVGPISDGTVVQTSLPWRARDALHNYCIKRELDEAVIKAGLECFERAED